jgi:hypothetical protein
MKVLYNSFIKKRVVFEIKRIGDGVCEIILDIPLSFSIINTIEFDEIDNRVLLHVFEFPDYDICYDFDDLEIDDKIEVINTLKAI